MIRKKFSKPEQDTSSGSSKTKKSLLRRLLRQRLFMKVVVALVFLAGFYIWPSLQSGKTRSALLKPAAIAATPKDISPPRKDITA
jgi:hypothetical protein